MKSPDVSINAAIRLLKFQLDFVESLKPKFDFFEKLEIERCRDHDYNEATGFLRETGNLTTLIIDDTRKILIWNKMYTKRF